MIVLVRSIAPPLKLPAELATAYSKKDSWSSSSKVSPLVGHFISWFPLLLFFTSLQDFSISSLKHLIGKVLEGYHLGFTTRERVAG